ncbi:YiiD C-terminal domain-containing protein [Paraferrimonas haliotis]|uniref:Thioesterase putative domain-containing protein n=1 Tax=Paraferrimonas haliotis TaxID=2013866 RepID=A0AA37WY57_9GAMM|nr:YiiD C-terminal domain-containing protein [Paraferrimonas haliotis]GLS84962.1 hypothetical protein GCM10007894_29390 [Paraferrimonas haliotis]
MQNDYQQWLQSLQTTWHDTIPMSRFMGLRTLNFDGSCLTTEAELAPNNLNLHQTMFAGSIYTQCTLTGWGLVWMQLKQQHLQGDIVLAHGDIRYLRPVTDAKPLAAASVKASGLSSISTPLPSKLELTIEVNLLSKDASAAKFIGRYVVLKPKY